MAKLKMLKLPKKPQKSASLETKKKYLAKVKAIMEDNKRRQRINEESERLSHVIAGIGNIKVLPASFTAKNVRAPKRKMKKKSAAPKRRVSGVKRKTAHKRTTRKKAARRRR